MKDFESLHLHRSNHSERSKWLANRRKHYLNIEYIVFYLVVMKITVESVFGATEEGAAC
jgi:hypothetical protein